MCNRAGVCPFGLAHVDVPKGDLDGSADPLDVPSKDAIVQSVDVYGTWGTTELYPLMTNSEGEVLKNTAHWYVECSNKGLCDRKSGVCKCFAGYDGTSCQRGKYMTSCPWYCDLVEGDVTMLTDILNVLPSICMQRPALTTARAMARARRSRPSPSGTTTTSTSCGTAT